MVLLGIAAVVIVLILLAAAVYLLRHISLLTEPRKKRREKPSVPEPRIAATRQTKQYVEKYFRGRVR